MQTTEYLKSQTIQAVFAAPSLRDQLRTETAIKSINNMQIISSYACIQNQAKKFISNTK